MTDLNISRFHRVDRPRDFPDYVYFTIGTGGGDCTVLRGELKEWQKARHTGLNFVAKRCWTRILDDMER